MCNHGNKTSVIYTANLGNWIHRVAQKIVKKTIPFCQWLVDRSTRICKGGKCKYDGINYQSNYWKIREVIFYEIVQLV